MSRFSRLPVGGLPGAHAQQLAPVARPVEPLVVVVPGERRGLRGRGLERPRLVVEPRRLAVEHRCRDQGHERGQHGERRGRRRVRPAQLLEPQERDHQQREDRAADELAFEVERDDRDGVERGRATSSAAAGKPSFAAPRPEREQRGEHDERAGAERDHRAHPLVEPAVGHAHARQVRDAARDAARQLAPAAGQQQLVGHAARHQHERDERDDRRDRGERAQAAFEPAGGQHRADREQPDGHDRPAAPGLGGLEQRHPVQRPPGRERGERERAGERDRQDRLAARDAAPAL